MSIRELIDEQRDKKLKEAKGIRFIANALGIVRVLQDLLKIYLKQSYVRPTDKNLVWVAGGTLEDLEN